MELPCLCNTQLVDHVYITILWAYASSLVICFEILCTSPGQRAFPSCSQYKVPLNRHDTQPGTIFSPQSTHWSAGGGDYYDLVGTALSRKNVCGLSGNSVSQRDWMCSFIKVVKKMHFSSHGIGSFHHKSNHEETLSIFVLSGSCTLVLKDPQQMIIWINTPAVGWCFDTASCLK